jgi:RCC1 and BTB domain-containing protein
VGNTRRSSTPLLVEALQHIEIASVTCSYHHSVAISVDGEVFAFGLNDYGQLGVGSVRNQVSPVSVCMPLGVKVLAASCGQANILKSTFW